MIDVHCHLNFKSFTDDYDDVIKRALAKGVKRIINVGTSLESSQWAVDLAEKYEELYAIVGIHPHHADKVQHNWIGKLEQIALHPKVLAIGEIGMDFYEYKSNGIVDPQRQEEVFIKQLTLAHTLNLPLQIHNRHAGEKVIEILEKHQSLLQDPPGMFHCFAASREVHKKALQMGFAIGFDGNSTYPGLAPGETVSLSELARETPLDQIVTETDSPYLTPLPHRGTRNEPAYVIIIGAHLAKLKDIPIEEFSVQTEKTTKRIFPKLH
jgi:TatD DNase family protein